MFWNRNKKRSSFAVVSEKDAKTIPYPYVYVEKDGTVRELHSSERRFLETPYHPADGSRPFIKKSFKALNPFGNLRGTCLRSKVPHQISIQAAPIEDPIPLLLQEIHEDSVKLAKENNFEMIEENGKTIYRRKKK